MSDIVEKLKELEACERKLAHDCDCSPNVTTNWKCANYCVEAADEIVRLRNELHIAKEWSARVVDGQEQDMTEITRLRAEVETLRATLRWYGDTGNWKSSWDHQFRMMTQEPAYADRGDKARAALGDTP